MMSVEMMCSRPGDGTSSERGDLLREGGERFKFISIQSFVQKEIPIPGESRTISRTL
jgi:hypothetical protein